MMCFICTIRNDQYCSVLFILIFFYGHDYVETVMVQSVGMEGLGMSTGSYEEKDLVPERDWQSTWTTAANLI